MDENVRTMTGSLQDILNNHDFDNSCLYFDLHTMEELEAFNKELSELCVGQLDEVEPFNHVKKYFRPIYTARIDYDEDDERFELEYYHNLGERDHKYRYQIYVDVNPGDLIVITYGSKDYEGHLIDITSSSYILEDATGKLISHPRSNITIKKKEE